MASNIHPEIERAAHRAAIERVIAHYPHINEDELHDLLLYFRRDASAYDRAIIASKAEIREQYRQLSRDHSLDRLRMVEAAVVALFVFLLVLAIFFFTFGDWEL